MPNRFRFVLPSLLLLSAAGCISFGYQRFRPREINDYDEMIQDLAPPHADGQWAWVRGRVYGDLDADEKDDEAVLVTLQDGSRQEPGPIQNAWILLITRDEHERPHLRLRRNIFAHPKSLASTPFPRETHLAPDPIPLREAGLNIVDVESTGHGLLIVTLWTEAEGDTVQAWHAAYLLEGKKPQADLQRVFSRRAVQAAPGLTTADLDKDGRDELLLEQALFPHDPHHDHAKLDTPRWLSVYNRGPDGTYTPGDGKFPTAFEPYLLPLYQSYTRELHADGKPSALAPYEYYLGLIHTYEEQPVTANRFFIRAKEHAGNDRLLQRIDQRLSSAE